VSDELADIQIYLLRLADALGVSLPDVVETKIRQNADKYPVELSKGNATKYSRRESK
jgi:NTP pyrophosphatase (non-canonical NTP hydrolase)